jgi:hypothetical protein
MSLPPDLHKVEALVEKLGKQTSDEGRGLELRLIARSGRFNCKRVDLGTWIIAPECL